MDAEFNDYANNGFGNTLTRDGQGIATANLPMGGFRHTGVGNGSAATDYAALGQVQAGTPGWIAGGGTADAITAAYAPAVTALVDGTMLAFRATAANATTTPTFAPNGLTARTIVKRGGAALVPGDISGNLAESILRYNLANTRWELLNPANGAGLFLIQTQTAAGVATIDFTTGIDATYNEYLFSLTGILPATNAQLLQIRISTDAGSTWKAGASDYSRVFNVLSSARTNTPSALNATTEMIMAPGLTNNTGRPLNGEGRPLAPASPLLHPFT